MDAADALCLSVLGQIVRISARIDPFLASQFVEAVLMTPLGRRLVYIYFNLNNDFVYGFNEYRGKDKCGRSYRVDEFTKVFFSKHA